LKILLTGADGFTGRPFAERAREAGHEVVPLASDLRDAAALAAEVKAVQPQAVVHLAGIAFVGHAHEEDFYAVNVVGTTNLLDALAQLEVPPRVVLLASSANIYGNCEQSPILETQPPAPVNHYAMSKLAMEHLARTYMERLPIIIARPFNYTGPGQDESFIIPKLVKHFALRLPTISMGNLHVEREFNDVRMVCQAYLLLLEVGAAGEAYNVCSGRAFELKDVIDRFARLSGHTLEVKVNPAFVRANEVHRLYGSPAKLFQLARQHSRSIESPPLEETLSQMLAAFKALQLSATSVAAVRTN
jgi:GDP-6-deoxy-D-talose 4-dehydrogenase